MRAATVFSALGDPVRAGIVSLLVAQGPMSVTQLSQGFPITRQAVGKHVRVLREASVISVEKVGREQVVRVQPSALQEASAWLNVLATEWDRRLERLVAAVEN